MKGEEYKEILAIKEIESMLPGFHKLMCLLAEGKSPEYLEGFFEGMITMMKIELGIELKEGD